VAKAEKEDTELLIARYEGALEALTHDMDKAVGDLPQLAKDCSALAFEDIPGPCREGNLAPGTEAQLHGAERY